MGKRASTKGAAAASPVKAVEAPAKKAKVAPAADPAFTSVSDAIMGAEQLPDRVRSMLVEMMPFSLKYASDERHELQSMAVGMIEQALTAKKDALATTAAATESSLSGLKASESQLGTNVTDSEAALAAQKEVVEAKKNALADAKAADATSATNLSEKKSEQKAGEKKFNEMQKDEVAIKAAFEEHFPPMKEGESSAHYKKLQPFLTKLKLEATLLTALPSCCSKTVAERGSFDNIALEEFEKTFKEKIAALGEAVANEGPAAAARQSATEAAEKDREAKKAALDAAKAENDAAGKELKEKEAALKAAKKAVEEFQPKVVEMTGQLEKEQQASSEFASGPYADFNTLKSRVAKPPEEPAAEAPAEEAAAEPAAEAAA